MNIQTQLEKTSNLKRKLKITVPAEVIADQFQRQLLAAQKEAKIKGFRPGHVPLNVIKQYYGDNIRHNLFHRIVDESYQHALVEHKLRPVSRPKILTSEGHDGDHQHEHHTIAENQPLSFTAEFEIMPDVDVKSYTGLSATRKKIEVTEKDVDQVVEQLRDYHAMLEPIADEAHKAKQKDYVDFDFDGGVVTDSGTVEPREGMKGQRTLMIGSGELIPGFEDELEGMKAGETKTFRIKFPKDYTEASLAEKEAEFKATINSIKNKKLPELTEEFAKEAGYESISDMREKLRKGLTETRTDESNAELRNSILEELINKNPFELPESLLAAQANALARDFIRTLQERGFNQEMVAEALKREQDALKKRAEQQVRAGLLLDTISRKEKIDVTTQAYEDEVSKIAASMSIDRKQVADFYEKDAKQRENLDFQIRENLTVQFLIDNAKVKEK